MRHQLPEFPWFVLLISIVADATNDRAEMQLVAVDTTNQAMVFTFTYRLI